MTAKEMIEKLKTFPQDASIAVFYFGNVTKIEFYENEEVPIIIYTDGEDDL